MSTRPTPSAVSWNARRATVWAELQEMLDHLFEPFVQVLMDALAQDRSSAVLDIGCGAGATTLAAAAALAPEGRCTGLDVSDVLVATARRRAAALRLTNADFILGDAQRLALPAATFDAVISRFGVMFFDDPTAAFANIRGAVRSGGWLTCIVWRSPADNPFMTTAERAVAPLLGDVLSPDPDPDAPGQFAFADAGRVQRILTGSGWADIEIRSLDVPCRLPKDDLAVFVRRMGRMGAILPDLDDETRSAVEAALDQAFASFVSDGVAEFRAACWLVRARAG